MHVRVKDPTVHVHEHIIVSGFYLQLLGGALQGLLRRYCNCPRVNQVNGKPSISTAAHNNIGRGSSAAQHSTAQHSVPRERPCKYFWTMLKGMMQRAKTMDKALSYIR